jgi:hypothetical protein
MAKSGSWKAPKIGGREHLTADKLGEHLAILQRKSKTARSEARTADRKKAGVVASPRKVRAAIKKKK